MDQRARTAWWRVAVVALCVVAPFVVSSWFLVAGLRAMENADDTARVAESARADLNALAALENGAEAGEDIERRSVTTAADGLRAAAARIADTLPPERRDGFVDDIATYVDAASKTAFDYLDGADETADELDDEVTDPLHRRLVHDVEVARTEALSDSDTAREDALLGLGAGAVGVVTSLTVFALLVARLVGRRSAHAAREGATLGFKAIIEDSTDHVYVFAADGTVQFMSPSAERAVGRRCETAEELQELLGDEIAEAAVRLLREPPGATEEVPVHIHGRTQWFEVSARNNLDRPDVHGLVVIGREVTAERALREQLVEQATVDDLTGLPNRRAIRDTLDRAIARAARVGSGATLVLIDLDGFKGVNDTLGHPIGDRLLTMVGQRLGRVMRAGEIVGRLGGDEFAAVLEGSSDPLVLGTRLLETLETPFEVDEHLLSISASLGVATDPGHGDVDELFRQADIALYEAKRTGRSRMATFETEMQERVLVETRLEREVREAAEREEFRLEYQPLVAADEFRTTGFEALMRWTSPKLGNVPPLTFIPLMEQNGMIIDIGRWALGEACRQLAVWHRLVDDPTLTMSVNASVIQLEHERFVDDVLDAIRLSGIDAGCLQIEVTESVLISDGPAVVERLVELRRHGVGVALDDFGTGYSSMSQLRNLPVDCLKIDRAFVRELGADDDRSMRVISAVVELGRAFGLSVVAEGVEERSQLTLLNEAGCESIQGYFVSRPLPPEQMAEFLVGVPSSTT